MKKSADRVYDHALEKYHRMCGTPFEQLCNKLEAEGFDELVAAGIVVVTDQGDRPEYQVQRCDVDMRFFEEFDQRLW